MEQHFPEFPLHFIFLPKFFRISFQWFVLRKFDVYPDFLETFPGSFSFKSFVMFGLLESQMLVVSYLHQVIFNENLPFIFVNYRFGYFFFFVNVKAFEHASLLRFYFYYLLITLTFAHYRTFIISTPPLGTIIPYCTSFAMSLVTCPVECLIFHVVFRCFSRI